MGELHLPSPASEHSERGDLEGLSTFGTNYYTGLLRNDSSSQ
jgi:hypothetical protein